MMNLGMSASLEVKCTLATLCVIVHDLAPRGCQVANCHGLQKNLTVLTPGVY